MQTPVERVQKMLKKYNMKITKHTYVAQLLLSLTVRFLLWSTACAEKTTVLTASVSPAQLLFNKIM